MQIRDPDVLLSVIQQLKSQFASHVAELYDALAVAHVRNAGLEAEVARLNTPSDASAAVPKD